MMTDKYIFIVYFVFVYIYPFFFSIGSLFFHIHMSDEIYICNMIIIIIIFLLNILW